MGGPRIRVLGLGNDLLADDAFGIEVVRALRDRLPDDVQTATSIASGFALLDEVVGADRLVVVDTITGEAAGAGMVRRFVEADITPVPGSAPHYVGLFETLRLGRELELRVPREVVILAVHADDCLTIGGPMSAAVRAAVPTVVEMVEQQIAAWSAHEG